MNITEHTDITEHTKITELTNITELIHSYTCILKYLFRLILKSKSYGSLIAPESSHQKDHIDCAVHYYLYQCNATKDLFHP